MNRESYVLGYVYRPQDMNDAYLIEVLLSISTAKDNLLNLECSALVIYEDFNLSQT